MVRHHTSITQAPFCRNPISPVICHLNIIYLPLVHSVSNFTQKVPWGKRCAETLTQVSRSEVEVIVDLCVKILLEHTGIFYIYLTHMTPRECSGIGMCSDLEVGFFLG